MIDVSKSELPGDRLDERRASKGDDSGQEGPEKVTQIPTGGKGEEIPTKERRILIDSYAPVQLNILKMNRTSYMDPVLRLTEEKFEKYACKSYGRELFSV